MVESRKGWSYGFLLMAEGNRMFFFMKFMKPMEPTAGLEPATY